ncbi:hypothetical protein [Salibacterium aidingense]|uniref:hypothetical protein n=1 Tax=Salibacterium aidingense TaxID=384933 RepID=UPI0012EBF040|nr:hypothetical protein [Salibacterium aidingense]
MENLLKTKSLPAAIGFLIMKYILNPDATGAIKGINNIGFNPSAHVGTFSLSVKFCNISRL